MNGSTLFPRLAHSDAHTALVVGDRSLSYAALARACAGHLEALARADVRPGDRVAVFTQPGIETAVALVAHAHGGVVSVPVNPSIGDHELAHIVGDARPVRALATNPASLRGVPEGLVVDRLELTTAEPRAPFDGADGDPLMVLYTSGTTGAPKGAVITRGSVARNLDGLADAWAWTERDILVHALPLFHAHGLVLGLFGPLRRGATVRWHAKFAPERIAAEFADGASMLFAVPTMYHRLVEAGERDGSIGAALRHARLLVSGSAALPVREHARIEALVGQRAVERYGLTETLINCAIRSDGDRRAGFVGPAVPGVEVRLVDDARAPIAARDDVTLGEIAVRGPNVFAGYLNRPDATAAVCDGDGWFYTGDLATMAPDGYVRIVGRRATDLIKTGGFKVGAGEVEAALLEHPSVREAAVIGVPDDDLGERIVAFVVVREPVAPGALTDFVARSLSPHKRPRAVHLVDELPRNAMGKVVKAPLRARAARVE
ncbi:MAG: AMP-binding protein [Deltaproteobacteria bacterium]